MPSSLTKYLLPQDRSLVGRTPWSAADALVGLRGPVQEAGRGAASPIHYHSNCNRTARLLGGASAVPDSKPAKLITLRRSVKLMASACKRSERFSRTHRSAPTLASNEKEGRTRPRSRL